MAEYKVKVCKYVEKDTFIVEANNEQEAERLALIEYNKVRKSYSVNIREVGVNGN